MPKLKMPVLALDGGAPGYSLDSTRRVAENVESHGIGGHDTSRKKSSPKRSRTG